MRDVCTDCGIYEHSRCTGCGCWCSSHPDTRIRIGSNVIRQLNEMAANGYFGAKAGPADILQRVIEEVYNEQQPKNYQTSGFDRQ